MWYVKCRKKDRDGKMCEFSMRGVKRRKVEYETAKHITSTGHRCAVIHIEDEEIVDGI